MTPRFIARYPLTDRIKCDYDILMSKERLALTLDVGACSSGDVACYEKRTPLSQALSGTNGYE